MGQVQNQVPDTAAALTNPLNTEPQVLPVTELQPQVSPEPHPSLPMEPAAEPLTEPLALPESPESLEPPQPMEQDQDTKLHQLEALVQLATNRTSASMLKEETDQGIIR